MIDSSISTGTDRWLRRSRHLHLLQSPLLYVETRTLQEIYAEKCALR